MERPDCRVFEDQLDALVRGDLSEEGMAQLHGHAAECRECAALLRMEEHLATPSLEELEARVPEYLVASMWEDVQGALDARAGRSSPRTRWLTPVLAAAAVVLLLANGLALRALGQAEDRARVLTEQILDQQRRLVLQGTGDAGTGAIPAGLAGRAGIFRTLGGGEALTVADLRALLDRLPPGMEVMSGIQTRALASSRLVPTPWRDALSELDAGREITAADLLRVLEGMDLPADARVPTTRLFELLS